MLDSYYTKDDAHDQYLDSRLPYINVLDIAVPVEPHPSRWRSAFMECTKINLDDHLPNRTGLEYANGKILQITPERGSGPPIESAFNCFAADSRGEASAILWAKIISSYSKEGKYEVVLHPETATRIASKVLALTSQGRGYTVPWECGSLVKMPNGSFP